MRWDIFNPRKRRFSTHRPKGKDKENKMKKGTFFLERQRRAIINPISVRLT